MTPEAKCVMDAINASNRKEELKQEIFEILVSEAKTNADPDAVILLNCLRRLTNDKLGASLALNTKVADIEDALKQNYYDFDSMFTELEYVFCKSLSNKQEEYDQITKSGRILDLLEILTSRVQVQ